MIDRASSAYAVLVTRRHQAELAARESAHAEAMRDMKQSYEAQIGEMKSAIHALLNELRRERGQPLVEYPPARTVADRRAQTSATTEALRAPASNDNASQPAPAVTTSRPSLPPDQTAHFGAIYAC